MDKQLLKTFDTLLVVKIHILDFVITTATHDGQVRLVLSDD